MIYIFRRSTNDAISTSQYDDIDLHNNNNSITLVPYMNFEKFDDTPLESSQSLFLNKTLEVVQDGLQGWCSLYECSKTNRMKFSLLTILAVYIFSPWTVFDGCIGGFFAEVSGETNSGSSINPVVKYLGVF